MLSYRGFYVRDIQSVTPEGEEYILIGDIYDPEIKTMVRLLNPITVMLRQEQVLLAYPFHYLTAVNGRASEMVINYENRKNFTGCDDKSPVNPTCGLKHEKGKVVKYSEGFCCYCSVSGKQIRGGQDCSITDGPNEDTDLEKYKASAHCLLFHDVWYTVNELNSPSIQHTVYIQVFNRQELSNGSTTWVDLTQGEEFTIGTQNPYQFDENKTIVGTYITERPGNGTISVPFKDKRLLIPQPQPTVEREKLHAAVKNGARDYILLSKDKINSAGDECDKAGVSYEAFGEQDDRCEVPRNTCLSNQPLDFWEEDDNKRKSGGKGTNLLQFYGEPYKEPILVNDTTHEHWLALEYYTQHLSVIYIELNADKIVALRAGKYAQIASVVTTSSSDGIDFHVAIINAGLVSSEFSVQAVRCSYDIPDTAKESSVITAQGKHDFVVTTKYGNIEVTEAFTCVVEVSSTLHGIIAMRKATIKPGKRCICYLHCNCKCIGGSLTCEPMDEKLYHLAGFRGSVPLLFAKPLHKSWFRKHPIAATIAVLLILLFFGCLKAGLGLLGYSKAGDIGLEPCLYGPKNISRYYDPDLKDVDVLYDDEGYPIHPDTRQHAKVIGPQLQFILNALFCFIWPCILIGDNIAKRRKAALAAGAEDVAEGGDPLQDSIVMKTLRENKSAMDEEERLIYSAREESSEASEKKGNRRGSHSVTNRRHSKSESEIQRSLVHSSAEGNLELETSEDDSLGPLEADPNRRFRKGVTILGSVL